MGLFENLSDRFNHIFSKLKNRGKLSELEIKQAMREIRIALLEADVNFNVVKEFVSAVSEKALHEDILKSLTPAQQVVKIVNDELTALMGSTHSKLAVSPKPPTIYMMCGLQGSGKTTMCGKLARFLKKQGKNVLLVACDIYRPAAIKQLAVVGEKVGAPVFEMGQTKPEKIAKEAVRFAEKNGHDTVIIDTAGRLHIDGELMDELVGLKKSLKPAEILLVVDAMTGQDAVNVAYEFNRQLDVTGVILTKLDGDTRGGAALSVKAVTGKPIKFCGIGEKPDDIEAFHPDRMASRILGMGDVLSLIEKAEQAISVDDAKDLTKKIKEKSFTLDDYLKQIESIKKMGSIGSMMQMIPGLSQKMRGHEADIDESKIVKTKAIIQSMTKKERRHPEILKASHRKRIAQGSGTTIQDVNAMLKQFETAKQMMNRMMSNKKLPF
jgi:signal recognition particle subunit SRP54